MFMQYQMKIAPVHSILKKALFPFSKILNHHFNQYLYSKQDINSKFKPFVLLVQNIPSFWKKVTNWYVFLFKDKLANWLDRDIAVST